MCENMEMDEKQHREFLQLNFFFMPCYFEKCSFPDLPAVPARARMLAFVSVIWKVCVFGKAKKWIIFLTSNKINLKKCLIHRSMFTQCTLLLLFWLLFACQCGCLFKLNMFNGFWTAFTRRKIILLWSHICASHARHWDYSVDGTEHWTLNTHLADEKHFSPFPHIKWVFVFDVNKISNSPTYRFPPSKIIFCALCNKNRWK